MTPILLGASPAISRHPEPLHRIVMLFWPGKTEYSVHDATFEDGKVSYQTGNWFKRGEDAAANWLGRCATRFASYGTAYLAPAPTLEMKL